VGSDTHKVVGPLSLGVQRPERKKKEKKEKKNSALSSFLPCKRIVVYQSNKP
jgi:hypothetical protein